jgi:transcriptional regulator with GAF, ATPase, and Fis domain
MMGAERTNTTLVREGALRGGARDGVGAAPAPTLAYRITVTSAPDAADPPPAVLLDPARPTPLLLGQGSACELRLSDPLVSRRHASLSVIGDELRLVDLGSTNGTFVDRVRVTEAFLRGGERILLGDTSLLVEAAARTEDLAVSPATRFGRVVGASLEMRRLYYGLERIAKSDVPVVLEGETGTGKEVVAEALHEASARANGPFVVFDCTAVPPNLAEAELFGHERGAFTGAVAARRGVFEQAHGGTLLIDEIGDFDLALQPKLLRALERGEIRRIGADKWMKVDVRVIAATRRNLDREVEEGRFRDDLFFRLMVARIELPPLRCRRGDIGVLTEYFWRQLGGGEAPVPYDLLQPFESYSWPGNVRELRNAVARRVALGDWQQDPPARANAAARDTLDAVLALNLPFARAREHVMTEFQRRYVEYALAQHGGNVAKAAEASGIGLRYFYMLRSK